MATGGAIIGALRVTLGLDSANFEAGSRRARETAHDTTTAVQKSFGMLKAAAGAAFAAIGTAELVAATQRAFDYADAIVDLGARTGASTKTIQEFRYAAQMTGADIATADAALDKYAKNFGSVMNGNDAMAKKFHELGVTSRDFDTALRQTIEGISKLPTIAQRNAAAFDMFGKSAATLTALMGENTTGYDELAAAARSLGIVIEDDVLQNAGQFNDTLDRMKMVMDAQFANAIIQNADAVSMLANAFTTAAGAAANFLSQMRVQSLMARRNGNLWTPMLDRITGKDTQADAAKELRTFTAGRSAVYADNSRRYREGIREGRDPNEAYMQALKGENQQILAAELAARKAARQGRPTSQTIGDPLPTGAKPEKPEKPKPDRTAEFQERYQRDLDRLKDQELAAQLSLTTDLDRRAEIEAARHALDRKQFAADIAKRQKDGELTAAQAKALQDQYDANYVLESRAAMWAQLDGKLRDQLDQESTAVSLAAERLHEQAGMARTAEERRRIELQLLDLAIEQEKIDARRAIDSQTASDAQRQEAQMRIAALDKVREAGTARINRDTLGPMGRFMDEMPRNAAELNEAYQKVAADGLASLNDGLTDAVMRSRTFGEVWSNVKNQIIAGLLQIALQQQIIKPIGQLLSGGGVGGLLGRLGSLLGGGGAAASLFSGAPTDLGLGNALVPMDMSLVGLDNGGSLIGGRPGVDQNVLAINGIPRARVSAHERINITPAGDRGMMRGGDNFYFSGVMTNDQFWTEVDRRGSTNATATTLDNNRREAKAARRQMGTGRR